LSRTVIASIGCGDFSKDIFFNLMNFMALRIWGLEWDKSELWSFCDMRYDVKIGEDSANQDLLNEWFLRLGSIRLDGNLIGVERIQ
jgi:hypothetical protein